MGHWGTCPNRLPQLILFCFTKYDGNLLCEIYLQNLRAAVITISSFFYFCWKNEKCASNISVSRCIYRILYVCDLSYFDVVLCPSSRQILATPLTPSVNWLQAQLFSLGNVLQVAHEASGWTVFALTTISVQPLVYGDAPFVEVIPGSLNGPSWLRDNNDDDSPARQRHDRLRIHWLQTIKQTMSLGSELLYSNGTVHTWVFVASCKICGAISM